MALPTKNVKGLSPKIDGRELSPELSVSSGNNNNNNNAPKYGTVIPNRIFVGGISSATTEADLTQLFSNYGRVTGAKIIADRAGVSKGYGFVTFESEEEAKRLQKDAENIILRERRLNIAPAIKKQGFGRGFDQATGAVSAPSPAGTAQVYHQNGLSYAFPNGMAFFPQGSASASITPMPSAPVDPTLYPGAYTAAAPHMATYAPPMIYQAPVYFQNPQYPQYQIPYDGCYTLGEGQGAPMILQNGSGDNNGLMMPGGGTSQYFVTTSNGGGSNGGSSGSHQGGGGGGGGASSPGGGGGASTPQHYAAHPADLTATYTLHHQIAAPTPYACLALPQPDPTAPPPPIIHYTMARRPYEPGIVEVRPNSRNGPVERCYSQPSGEVAAIMDSGNETAKPDSTADVAEKRGATPVVSLLKLESEEADTQLPQSRPVKSFTFTRSSRGKQNYYQQRQQHLNNNNPEATNRNLTKIVRGSVKRGGHTPSPPPASHLYPSVGRSAMIPPFPQDPNQVCFNLSTSSLQVPQYPYYTPTRAFYNTAGLPPSSSQQQRRLSNSHRRQNAGGSSGRGSRYRGGSHNSSRSSSQGRGGQGGSSGGGGGSVSTEGSTICSAGGNGGGGGGPDCGGEGGALTPPTTPRCSPHDTSSSSPPPSAAPTTAATTAINSISRSIHALSI